MSDEVIKYEIGGKVYVQKKLVWGQVQQLITLLKGIEFGSDISPVSLIGILGDKVPIALAILLTEEGKSLSGKNLEEIGNEITFDIPVDMIIKVLEDFFECNPTALYLEKLATMIGKVNEEFEKKKMEISSTESQSSSAEGT